MSNVELYNLDKKIVGNIEISDEIFDAKVNPILYNEVIKWQLAKRRKGNASTKDRSQITGSTKKLYRQKGTGNARRGSVKSPVLRGGGTVFGPKPRDFSYSLPKKVKKAAIRSILTTRLKEKSLFFIDSMEINVISTKKMLEKFKNFCKGKTLVVDMENERMEKSVRNIKGFDFLPVNGMNLFDLLHHDNIFVSKNALNQIEGIYSHE